MVIGLHDYQFAQSSQFAHSDSSRLGECGQHKGDTAFC